MTMARPPKSLPEEDISVPLPYCGRRSLSTPPAQNRQRAVPASRAVERRGMGRVRRSANGARDSVDRLAAAWETAVPDFSTNSLQVFGRIQYLARFYEDALANVARRHGLIPSDVYVLLALRRASRRLNPAELIEELSVTSGAVTKRL